MRLIEPSWSRFLVCWSHLCRDWLITCQSDGWMDRVAEGGTENEGKVDSDD